MTFDPATFRLNSPLGKRILATTRDGDYAHPGEEEAIVRTLQPFASIPPRRWLDAGCGRGGTAAFVAAKGWAEVTAFDIDAVSVREARQAFPAVHFHACGVLDAPRVIPGKFDLIYLFNAFYAFPDQAGALRALRELAGDSATLVLFDYVDHGGFSGTPLARLPEAGHWQPVREGEIRSWMAAAGWKLEAVENLDADYERWYRWLIERFETRRALLEAIAPPEAIAYARDFFTEVLGAIQAGILGGGIFVARATT
jgi:SAM-dependent methyltransferase